MISDKYSMLNDRQREAVLCTEGPLLILAGAGSGKTKVLTCRIAYLIEEMNVPSYNILAITFTNKAAEEMKTRVEDMVSFGDSVWVATFHSTCVRILRRHIDCLGYGADFTIYDTDDQKTLLRHIIKDLNLDPKMYKERAMISLISAYKNEMLTPEDMRREGGTDFRKLKEAMIYEEYRKRLKANNALDFDDLLVLTVQLFREAPEVLKNYQNRFQYIMVDEYQDTNRVQFELVRLLAGARRNLCVVGDDDQSIYGFRGADIRNILEFEEVFPNAKVVRLEQNYRSTNAILNCANAVIQHNTGRKEKHLWSDLGKGTPVTYKEYASGYDEADAVIRSIRNENMRGAAWQDFAVLYRTNAQSRAFEEKCISLNVPYRLVGGVNFYQRAEVKDLLAYLKTLASGRDDISVQRIINVPRRGIGQTTIDRVQAYARSEEIGFYEALLAIRQVPGAEKAAKKIEAFTRMIGELREYAADHELDALIREIIKKTDYMSTLEDLDEDQQQQKKENMDELVSKAHDFYENREEEAPPSLSDFLEEVSLVADIDSVQEGEDRLLLMTLHGSKGLEFPVVFICGMEDGLFPSFLSIESGDPMAVEEERRLCYVGITRAMRELHLSSARMRTMHGEAQYHTVSRFIKEIPRAYLDRPSLKDEHQNSFSFGGYTGEEPFPRRENRAAWSIGLNKKGTSAGAEMPVKKHETFGKTFEVKKASSLDYSVGDRVRHARFGEGTVKDITEEKKDFVVLVDFDSCGDKRMFASFAKLIRI